MPEFENKVVIVTGGAKGIGKGISLAFAREAAQVVCADIDEEAGEKISEEAKGLAGSIHFRAGDVSKNSECEAVAETAASEFGGVDVLCNNVGIQPLDAYLPAHEYPEELWDRIMDVNLKSYFLMAKCCIPQMLKRGGGAIINTASVQGLQSMKGVSAYAASKGGILSLTRQLALEYATDNIRVLAVNPGAIKTPMMVDSVAFMSDDPDALKKMAANVPAKRLGTPEDIAEVVLFLASPRASYMTGEYVCVDGGYMAFGQWGEV